MQCCQQVGFGNCHVPVSWRTFSNWPQLCLDTANLGGHKQAADGSQVTALQTSFSASSNNMAYSPTPTPRVHANNDD